MPSSPSGYIDIPLDRDHSQSYAEWGNDPIDFVAQGGTMPRTNRPHLHREEKIIKYTLDNRVNVLNKYSKDLVFEQQAGVTAMFNEKFGTNLNFENLTTTADERRDTDGGKIVQYKRRPYQETPISYSNIVKRQVPVATFQWAVSDTVGTLLYYASVPYDLVSQNCQLFQPFANNYLWRGSVRIRVHINSTTFHQGLLWIGYMPGVNREKAVNYVGSSRTMWSNLPSTYINAFTANDAEIIIPFTHLRDLAYTNQLNPEDRKSVV